MIAATVAPEFTFEKLTMLNSWLLGRTVLAFKAWTAFACLVLSVSSAALVSDKCGSLDRAANAIRLAQILYPELRGRDFSLQFSEGTGGPLSGPTDVGSFLIAIDRPQWHPPHQSDGQPNSKAQSSENENSEIELPLYLQFSFIRGAVLGKNEAVIGRELSCQPLNLSNTRGSKQIHEAWDVINAHPEWTDEQDLEAARKVGMRFGPEKKPDLLRILPLKELSGIYGPLQITKATFKVAGLKEAETSFADLHWFITARRVGTQKTMQIMVEPFQGKIIAISSE